MSNEAPTSNEYDYTREMKHVVQKIDVDRALRLAALDKSILKKITASEAQDRMERLLRGPIQEEEASMKLAASRAAARRCGQPRQPE